MRALVIGMGSIGRRHAENLTDLGIDVIGIDIETDYRTVLDNDQVDFAVICTPSSFHATQCKELLSRNIDFLCEKPVMIDSLDTDSLIAAVGESMSLSMIACNIRFTSAVKRMKEEFSNGVLHADAVFSYDLAKWRPGIDHLAVYSALKSLGGGVVLDCIHEWDYMSWLFGAIEKISISQEFSGKKTVDAYDSATSILKFERGTTGTITADFFSETYTRFCQIFSDDGSEHVFKIEPEQDMYVNEIMYFIDCLNTRAKPMNGVCEAVTLTKMLIDASTTNIHHS